MWVYPDLDATGVFIRDEIEFVLGLWDPDAAIEVYDDADLPVLGTSTVVEADRTVRWSGLLAPTSSYRAVLTYECGQLATNFSTSATGPAVAADLEGRRYALAFSDPRDVASEYVSGTNFQIEILAERPEGLSMRIGTADEAGRQDRCAETSDAETTRWVNPNFEVAFSKVEGPYYRVRDIVLSCTLAPDAALLEGCTLSGRVPSRKTFGPGSCAILDCEPCSTGMCVPVLMGRGIGTPVEFLEPSHLVQVGADECVEPE